MAIMCKYAIFVRLEYSWILVSMSVLESEGMVVYETMKCRDFRTGEMMR